MRLPRINIGMKSLTRPSLVAAALALVGSGVALAGNDCGLNTLRGILHLRSQRAQHRRWYRATKNDCRSYRFHGRRYFIGPAATRSVNGVVARTPPGGTGSYTVEAGCKGSVAFTGGPSFDIFLSPSGDKVWMIQTNPDTVFQGTATRISQRTGIFDTAN